MVFETWENFPADAAMTVSDAVIMNFLFPFINSGFRVFPRFAQVRFFCYLQFKG